ncbi:hypothetical protein RJ035_000411 [Blastomyces gilchristii]
MSLVPSAPQFAAGIGPARCSFAFLGASLLTWWANLSLTTFSAAAADTRMLQSHLIKSPKGSTDVENTFITHDAWLGAEQPHQCRYSQPPIVPSDELAGWLVTNARPLPIPLPRRDLEVGLGPSIVNEHNLPEIVNNSPHKQREITRILAVRLLGPKEAMNLRLKIALFDPTLEASKDRASTAVVRKAHSVLGYNCSTLHL